MSWRNAFAMLGFGNEEAVAPVRNETVRQQPASKVTVLRTRRPVNEGNDIFTIEPSGYNEAVTIAEHFRENVSVIVNMANMSEVDCRKMVDFMLGLKHGLQGTMKRVTPKVFILTPFNVSINDEGESELGEDDLLIQP